MPIFDKRFLLILTLLVTSSLIYGGILFYSVENRYLRTVKSSRYMMHALGGMEGVYSYTNSIDALKASYQEGYRLFEVDLKYTSDNHLVLVHGWKKKDYNERIGIENCNLKVMKKEKQYVPTYKAFKKFSIQGKYKATDFAGLVKFMKKHKDMYVMLDIDRNSYEYTEALYQDIVRIAKENGAENILQNFIAGGYSTVMLDAVRSVYNFKLYNLYFPKDENREEHIFAVEDFIQYCKENKIQSFSVDKGVFTDEVAEQFRDSGLISYVFTINEQEVADAYLEKGASIIGTDFLR